MTAMRAALLCALISVAAAAAASVRPWMADPQVGRKKRGEGGRNEEMLARWCVYACVCACVSVCVCV